MNDISKKLYDALFNCLDDKDVNSTRFSLLSHDRVAEIMKRFAGCPRNLLSKEQAKYFFENQRADDLNQTLYNSLFTYDVTATNKERFQLISKQEAAGIMKTFTLTEKQVRTQSEFEADERLLEELASALENNRIEAWFKMHPDQTYPPFSHLSTSQQLKAAALLAQLENPEKLSHWTNALPNDLREFQSWLLNQDSLSTSDTFLQQFSQENRAIALALKVNKNKICIRDIKENINDELLLQMAPTLRYLDLRNIWNDSLSLELIRNCPNVYRLYINSYEGKDLLLPALPLCQTLDCSRCINLTALPELPLCQTLNFINCGALTALPELRLGGVRILLQR